MSITMDEEIKRWTALRKAALVLEIVQGKTMVAEAAGSLTCSPPRSRNGSTRARRGWRTPCAPSRKMCASSTSDSWQVRIATASKPSSTPCA